MNECCHIGCEKPAEFAIYTQRRGGGNAGPDHYSDDTYACTEHVGEMLSHQPDMANPDEVQWLVVPVTVPAGVAA